VIAESGIPSAANPLLQHALDTYASEINKTASVFGQFAMEDLPFRPHPRSSTTLEIFRHQLLSERRFLGDFLGSPEPDPSFLFPAADLRKHSRRVWSNWRGRGWPTWRSRTTIGGWTGVRSSMSNGNESGFSGGAYCIPRVIGRS
jgi:hypothetical protein